MTTSYELLTLMLALEHSKLDVHFCIAALDGVSEGQYSIREPRDEAERAKWLRELTSIVAELKLRPVIEFDEETLEILETISNT